MQYQGLSILLNCHGLEDFPVYEKGDSAASLLANWTAMWHPALLHACQKPPAWSRIDSPPEDVNQQLLLVPKSLERELPTGFRQRVEEDGGRLIQGQTDRWEIVRQALEDVQFADEAAVPSINEDLVRDFFALGYCYLQIQVLTRHMRYSSNLDQVFFDKQVLAAAANACSGDEAGAREVLGKCFDVLAEERNYYYPVDAFLMDVTLVANTTLGKSLAEQLKADHPQSWLLAASDLESLQSKSPESCQKLKEAVANHQIEIVGGNFDELPFPLMSQESMVRQFQKAIDVYESTLDARPYVFARRRFGLAPSIPQILEGFGYHGALHVSLDEGKFPEGMQAKTRWEGAGESSIQALAKVPLEIDKPDSFLNLGIKLGEAMDMDHLSVIWFAHWPGYECEWFDDLLRVRKYCNALGKFVTLSNFFAETEPPLHSDRFTADQYRDPYLTKAVGSQSANAVSQSIDFWKLESTLSAINTLNFLTSMMGKDPVVEFDSMRSIGMELDARFDDMFADSSSINGATAESQISALENQLQAQLQKSKIAFAEAVGVNVLDTNDDSGSESNAGVLVVNPKSFVRRMCIDLSQFPKLPDVEKPVYAVDQIGKLKHVVVDVPPLGFAYVQPGNGSGANSRDPLLAEENMLRNEFMEVVIDEATGGIRAIHDYKSRKNRISQKFALRYPKGYPKKPNSGAADSSKTKWLYGESTVDSLTIVSASRVLGHIRVIGKLLCGKKIAADFVADYRLTRGSRVLECDVEITQMESIADDKDRLTDEEFVNGEDNLSDKVSSNGSQPPILLDNPWESYFGVRFAWNDESAELFRSSQQMRYRVSNKRFAASHYLEIDSGKTQTTILNGGAPWFRQRGFRSIDLPLIVRGERRKKFTFGIGVDLKYPMQQAMGLISAPIVVDTDTKPQPDHCWLFHVAAKNVIATWWEPIFESENVVGFRVRLLETMGRSSKLALSALKPIVAAHCVTFSGTSKHACKIDNDQIQYEIRSHEFVELEARFVE